jgi:RimJ/RimL family protein N-acetyltransferase
MEKLGMQREDHLRKCIDRGENQSGDEYLYTLLEEEWFQGKLESVA